MVNTNVSTKFKLLQILRAQKQPISGETLATEIGVSRVSVWKAIQNIQAAGYGISSNRNGYYLDKDLEDSLYPWEFGNNETLVTHLAETSSTMIEAHRIAEQEESHHNSKPKIITADTQTNGQGHNKHKWITTQGSLAFTIITKNKIPSTSSHRVVMVSQIALAKILTEVSGKDFFVRWPNDIWSSKGKVCGVLDELSALGGICKWVNLGIGINLINKPSLMGTDCVFEKQNSIKRKEVLLSFWQEFQKKEKLITDETNVLSTEWNSRCCDIGKKVKLTNDNNDYIFESINGWGWGNFIQVNTNTKIVLPPGQISFVKQF